MKITDEQKRIRRMRRSYNDSRKQIKEAMAKCSVGTNTHLAHIRALSELDSKEREEEIKLGLSPQNLGAMIATEFLYISHVPVLPASREELDRILGKQMIKACEGLHYDEADEEIRRDLEEHFPSAK